jgi:hypothetical protein
VYAPTPQSFDEDTVMLAETFGGYAAVAMANAHRYDSTATLARHTQARWTAAPSSNRPRASSWPSAAAPADEAFAILAKVSEDSNRKLRDVAAAPVASALRPRRR